MSESLFCLGFGFYFIAMAAHTIAELVFFGKMALLGESTGSRMPVVTSKILGRRLGIDKADITGMVRSRKEDVG